MLETRAACRERAGHWFCWACRIRLWTPAQFTGHLDYAHSRLKAGADIAYWCYDHGWEEA